MELGDQPLKVSLQLFLPFQSEEMNIFLPLSVIFLAGKYTLNTGIIIEVFSNISLLYPIKSTSKFQLSRNLERGVQQTLEKVY